MKTLASADKGAFYSTVVWNPSWVWGNGPVECLLWPTCWGLVCANPRLLPQLFITHIRKCQILSFLAPFVIQIWKHVCIKVYCMFTAFINWMRVQTFYLAAPIQAWCPSGPAPAWPDRWERRGLSRLPAGRISAAQRAAGPTQLAAWARPACDARTGKAAAPPSHFEGTAVWWVEWLASGEERERERNNQDTKWIYCVTRVFKVHT